MAIDEGGGGGIQEVMKLRTPKRKYNSKLAGDKNELDNRRGRREGAMNLTVDEGGGNELNNRRGRREGAMNLTICEGGGRGQ